jgi:DNA processing protein
VLQALGYEAMHFDALVGEAGLSIGELSTVLLKMELQGLIRAMPGNHYVKV